MRKGLFAVVSSGVIAVAVGLGTSAATATTITRWTISPGGDVTGTAGKTVVTDTRSNSQVQCTSSSVDATLKTGTGKRNPLGTISAIAYNGCAFSTAGASITISASPTDPAQLRGITYSGGVTHGRIGNLQGSFSITGPSGTCSGTTAGTSATTPGYVAVTYHNATGVLTTGGGDLHAWNVTGNCLGALTSGDPITVVSHYKISPAQTITSP